MFWDVTPCVLSQRFLQVFFLYFGGLKSMPRGKRRQILCREVHSYKVYVLRKPVHLYTATSSCCCPSLHLETCAFKNPVRSDLKTSCSCFPSEYFKTPLFPLWNHFTLSDPLSSSGSLLAIVFPVLLPQHLPFLSQHGLLSYPEGGCNRFIRNIVA